MRFTCSGYIIRWRAAGEINIGVQTNLSSTLQIWRSHNSSTYILETEIPLLTCNGGNLTKVQTENVYECLLSTGIPVQQGDIFGLYMIAQQNTSKRFSVYFDSSNTSSPLLTNYYFDGRTRTTFSQSMPEGVEQALPLVAVEAVPNSKKSVRCMCVCQGFMGGGTQREILTPSLNSPPLKRWVQHSFATPLNAHPRLCFPWIPTLTKYPLWIPAKINQAH